MAHHVHRFQIEIAGAGERQQLPRQFRAAPGGALRARGHGAHALIGAHPRDQFRVHHDDVEQVIEVVRDPTRQLTERFHLLRLHQHRLNLGTLVNFLHQAVVGRRKLRRARDNPAFERIVELNQRLLRLDALRQMLTRHIEMLARIVLPDTRTQRRRHGPAQRLGVQWPLQYDYIAEPFEHLEALRRTSLHTVAREQDDGEGLQRVMTAAGAICSLRSEGALA